MKIEYRRLVWYDEKKTKEKEDNMKKTEKLLIVNSVLWIMVLPLIIACGTSANILDWVTNDNDWIGFWGSYIGTLIGSGVTLLVLWGTITDSRKAREREEKLGYYNHLVELQTSFVEDIANYNALVTTLFKEYTIEKYRECIKSGNKAAKRSMEIEILLKTRKDLYNVKILEKNLERMCENVNKIVHGLDVLALDDFTDKELMKKMDEQMDVILGECKTYIDDFAEIMKSEIND